MSNAETFNPMEQARIDAAPVAEVANAERERYEEWLGDQPTPEAAQDFLDFMESQPDITPEDHTTLQDARSTVGQSAGIGEGRGGVYKHDAQKPWIMREHSIKEAEVAVADISAKNKTSSFEDILHNNNDLEEDVALEQMSFKDLAKEMGEADAHNAEAYVKEVQEAIATKIKNKGFTEAQAEKMQTMIKQESEKEMLRVWEDQYNAVAEKEKKAAQATEAAQKADDEAAARAAVDAASEAPATEEATVVPKPKREPKPTHDHVKITDTAEDRKPAQKPEEAPAPTPVTTRSTVGRKPGEPGAVITRGRALESSAADSVDQPVKNESPRTNDSPESSADPVAPEKPAEAPQRNIFSELNDLFKAAASDREAQKRIDGFGESLYSRLEAGEITEQEVLDEIAAYKSDLEALNASVTRERLDKFSAASDLAFESGEWKDFIDSLDTQNLPKDDVERFKKLYQDLNLSESPEDIAKLSSAQLRERYERAREAKQVLAELAPIKQLAEQLAEQTAIAEQRRGDLAQLSAKMRQRAFSIPLLTGALSKVVGRGGRLGKLAAKVSPSAAYKDALNLYHSAYDAAGQHAAKLLKEQGLDKNQLRDYALEALIQESNILADETAAAQEKLATEGSIGVRGKIVNTWAKDAAIKGQRRTLGNAAKNVAWGGTKAVGGAWLGGAVTGIGVKLLTGSTVLGPMIAGGLGVARARTINMNKARASFERTFKNDEGKTVTESNIVARTEADYHKERAEKALRAKAVRGLGALSTSTLVEQQVRADKTIRRQNAARIVKAGVAGAAGGVAGTL
jgi:hypothetical protein